MQNAAQAILVSGKTATQHFKESLQSSVKGSNQNAKGLNLLESAEIVKASISATHYYLKFKPIDDKQLSLLKADSTLILYPFPLTNEVTPYSGSYRDPSVPENQPTYQYCAVPIAKALPNVPFEKLDDLFLPDESKSQNLVEMSYKGLELAINARVLAKTSIQNSPESKMPVQVIPVGGGATTNLVPPDGGGAGPIEGGDGDGGGISNPSDPFVRGDEWRPHGRITLYDESKQQTIGIEGVKVRARRWFVTHTGIADGNGYYAVDGWFDGPANYWLDFERYDFSVNDHRGGVREISGPHQRVAWDYQLVDFDKFCGNIFRAAYHYYYKDIQGLRRPPLNSFWATQVKLAAFDWYQNNDSGDSWPGRNLLLGSLIHIYHPQNGSRGTYATTIHELAHASHWNMSYEVIGQLLTTYGQTDLRVCETWATGVSWVLTKMEYPDFPGRQNDGTNYTNLVRDLIDSPGQESPNYGVTAPTDQVESYTIRQLEDALRNQRTLTDWKNNIYNDYSNATKQHLSTLFYYWDY